MAKLFGNGFRKKMQEETIGVTQITIGAWSPDASAQLPPEEVHLIVHTPDDSGEWKIIIRFKSPETLGSLIEELTSYRRAVWPGCRKLGD